MRTSRRYTRPPQRTGRICDGADASRSERPHLADVMTVLLYRDPRSDARSGKRKCCVARGNRAQLPRAGIRSHCVARASASKVPHSANALFDAILKNQSGVVMSVEAIRTCSAPSARLVVLSSTLITIRDRFFRIASNSAFASAGPSLKPARRNGSGYLREVERNPEERRRRRFRSGVGPRVSYSSTVITSAR